ncbi:MAG: patatin-like phospholipase family protein [Bacillota bacterium]
MYKILSIDGGGIRGIIPAMVLHEIEKRTGKPVSELFDLVAGTSTGGILALGLTMPGEGGPRYTAEGMIKLYEDDGKRIFFRPWWYCLASVWGWLRPKFPRRGIDAVLGHFFQEIRLNEALKDVIIASYDLENRTPWFFKTIHAKNPVKIGHDVSMKDAARATSAAPSFFAPVKIPAAAEQNYLSLVDGGMYANNPAMCAFVQAVKEGVERDDILVVSLGTGSATRPYPYKKARGWGRLGWILPSLDVVFDGVSDTVDYQLKQILYTDDENNRYYRFQVSLDHDYAGLDNASARNIEKLKEKARGLIEEQDMVLDALSKTLVKESGFKRAIEDGSQKEAAAARL